MHSFPGKPSYRLRQDRPSLWLPLPAGVPYDGSYDSFVELSREIMRGRNTKQQQETVAGVLSSLLPPQAPANFRKWFPFNKVCGGKGASWPFWCWAWGFVVSLEGQCHRQAQCSALQHGTRMRGHRFTIPQQIK